jgi:two-component system, chemotaxis family, protein-glutamate methylesterase/glutaminase
MQNCPYSASGYNGFDLIVVAASLGGPAALARVLGELPPDFPAAIAVAQHVSVISAPGVVQHLSQASALPVTVAQHGEPIVPGQVYVAPADQHLLITPDRRLCLAHTPKVKFCRPAAEPLFATAAGTYRQRALGLVLTGCNTDGAVGAQTINWMGGRVVAQDPSTARAGGMPRAAIASGAVDYVVPLDKIAAALVALVMVRGVAEYLKVVPTAA